MYSYACTDASTLGMEYKGKCMGFGHTASSGLARIKFDSMPKTFSYIYLVYTFAFRVQSHSLWHFTWVLDAPDVQGEWEKMCPCQNGNKKPFSMSSQFSFNWATRWDDKFTRCVSDDRKCLELYHCSMAGEQERERESLRGRERDSGSEGDAWIFLSLMRKMCTTRFILKRETSISICLI